MTSCPVDVVLYYYDEMTPPERARAAAHVRDCAACRQRLEELDAIRLALSARAVVDAPPAGDWSGFMRRLDEAVRPIVPAPAPAAVLERDGGVWKVRQLVSLAAMLAIVATGIFFAARFKTAEPTRGSAQRRPAAVAEVVPAASPAVEAPVAAAERSLRAVSAEHFERSKLVVLGLATRDPRATSAADWQYERQLAGTLLKDTRLYRLAAQDRGVSDVARVMRDLETVLLEASLSDNTDKDALARVQRLIDRRDLVVKMQVMAGAAGL